MSSAIVTTSLSSVDGAAGVLRYRGYSLEDLVARGTSYGEAVGLLDTGALGVDRSDALIAHATVDVDAADVGAALRIGLSRVSVVDDPIAFAAACGRLVSRLKHKKPEGSYASCVLRGVVDRCDDDDANALDSCFVVHLDHALNPGTLACRVAASTSAPLAACLTAGWCALEGPLHGGASSAVGRALDEMDDVTAWLKRQKEQKRRVPGFGHPVYRTRDPRAAVLKKLAQQTADRRREHRYVDRALALEDALREQLFPNVDFYAAAFYATLGVPHALHTALFFAARVVGWALHAEEQKKQKRVISPEAAYDGPAPRD